MDDRWRTDREKTGMKTHRKGKVKPPKEAGEKSGYALHDVGFLNDAFQFFKHNGVHED